MTPLRPRAGGTGRVVLWGTCDVGKPRVRLLLEGLRANGIDVVECREDLWSGIEDKSQVRGRAAWWRLAFRALRAYPRLAVRYLRLPAHDWVLLGYPALLDVFVIRALAWWRGAGVAMDWFLSAYDTIILDRGLRPPGHPLARLVRTAEWLAVRLPTLLFMDTRTHARRMESVFGLEHGRCRHVWVGAEDAFFSPRPATESARTPPFRVLFYGQFIPLHGIDTIVRAAALLRDHPIEWTLIGRGQEAARIRDQLERTPLPRLGWIPWVPYPDLLAHLRDADLCLGIFGQSDKAASVIPNKVFQIVAAGRPLVTRDSPAIREFLPESAAGVRLVPAGDAEALAAAVLAAVDDPDMHDGVATERLSGFDAAAVGSQLARLLSETPR